MTHMQDFSHHWSLDPGIIFLNHGSFGACPITVLETQRRLRDQMEREPVRFFIRELPDLLEKARYTVARFLGAAAGSLAFVTNATTAVNTVIASLDLRRGDELLVTDHEYNACRNVLDAKAAASGARVVVATVPFPLKRPEQVVEAVLERVTPQTRFLLIDQVTSQTGLIFPISDIVSGLRGKDIEILVDGAHAPGMLPLQLESLGVTYWTGNCHKWLCAPKGAAILWVREDKRSVLRPLNISHGANANHSPDHPRFRQEFDWTGTDDPTAFLAVPEAIRFMESLFRQGWRDIMWRNRALVLEGRSLVLQALDDAVPAPDVMIGSMVSIPLPASPRAETLSHFGTDPLQDRLLHDHRIEVPIMPWPTPRSRMLRISAQLYNRLSDYAHLAHALKIELARERDGGR